MTETSSHEIVTQPALEPIPGVNRLLAQIRPEWRAKSLIQRVERLLLVDPSSACQRLFNASIHDLRQKILITGVDIAKEAASRNKLPPIERVEDILENYSTARIIDLAYRIGFLSRPEWRRLERCYQIRRDLEHEDDQYEAEIEDVIYIFKTCVTVVLSRDPVELIELQDVQNLIDSPEKTVPSAEFIREYEMAPETRQRQILELLVNTSLNSGRADIIRQNAVDLLRMFSTLTKQAAKIDLATYIQKRAGRARLDLTTAKVASAAGVLPYLKQKQVKELHQGIAKRLHEAGYHWGRFKLHGKILDDLEDVGGLALISAPLRAEILLWMVLCYIGEPGGYGTLGRNRPVFFSNTAEPRIVRLIKSAKSVIAEDFESASNDQRVQAATQNKFVARRLEEIRDFLEPGIDIQSETETALEP